jgi:TRAP-type C4-dicarboxylate transport system substrate-binding protein
MYRLLWLKFAEELKKQSGGRLTLKIYHSGSLAKPRQALNAVKKGVADIAESIHAMNPGVFPLTSFISVPFLVDSSEMATYVLQGVYDKFPEIRAEHKDMHVLWLWGMLPMEIHTSKKPVRKLEDLKGLKLAGTAAPVRTLKALGAVPVVMPPPAIYQSLEKGVVDGVAVPWGWLGGWSLYEVTKYHTRAPLGVASIWHAMNKRTWEKLGPDLQKVLTDVISRGGAKWNTNSANFTSNRTRKKVLKLGHEIIELSPAEKKRWKETVRPLWNGWIKKMEAKGLPGRAVLDEAVRLAKEYASKR